MEIPKALIDRLKKNEEIAKKFNEIEVSILSILNFNDFFERLLCEISDKFSIPYIWISIIRESKIAEQLTEYRESELLRTSTAFVSKSGFLSIVKNRLTPLLANKNLDVYKELMPEISNYELGSIAIAPITLDGEIVGSINQADVNPMRFEPGIDTSLLEQLALKVSLCLSNVTAHEQLKFLAFHDSLTGLLNRGVMERILEREFLRADRYQTDLSLIFLDLDDFKTINDTAGHDVGDKALCLAANTLNQMKRDSDIVARFAGDEFVVILPSTGKLQAENYINRVKDYLDTNPLQSNSKSFYIKMSHGVSNISDPDISDPQALIKAADKLLYIEKEKKKVR
ncbi:MAG: sensor domain-containing diguanylate cyclase [Desulfobacterales bacterium]|nr:sensor domain-containing diguanylate cyclase [Desulfobacterales bacterium]